MLLLITYLCSLLYIIEKCPSLYKLNNSIEIIYCYYYYLQVLLKIIEQEEVIANNWDVIKFIKGRHFNNLEYKNNKYTLQIYYNSNYLFISI